MQIVFKAEDGTEFTKKTDCKKYEAEQSKLKEVKRLVTKIDKMMADKDIELKETDSNGFDNQHIVIEFMLANHEAIGLMMKKQKAAKKPKTPKEPKAQKKELLLEANQKG